VKNRLTFIGAAIVGAVMFAAVPADATGGPCNGRVDVNCQDTGNNYYDCTLYVQALNGCQIGS
jgi:hypothetical protein